MKFFTAHRDRTDLPIVIGAGEHDGLAPFLSRIAAGMRSQGCVNLRVETIKGAAHYVLEGKPEAVEELIAHYAGVDAVPSHSNIGSSTLSKEADMKLVSSGYADVNGLKLYHEIYGHGEPLVLIPGGLTTIREMQGWVQPLAMTRQVIAVEMQGHGRTADTDRPMSFATMGEDIAVLLDHLKIPKADLVGHSFGGAIAIRAAIQHPQKVRRLVVISSPYARFGWYPEARQGMSQVGAAMAENMMQTPTGKFSKQWPEPQRFPQFLDKMGKILSEDYDWSNEIAKLLMPVLLLFADNDSISQKHIAEFFALLGGGVKEPGWLSTQLSKSRLAVVPGYSHYNFISSAEVPQIIGKFLTDPLTNPPEGAAAASQAAPPAENRQ